MSKEENQKWILQKIGLFIVFVGLITLQILGEYAKTNPRLEILIGFVLHGLIS